MNSVDFCYWLQGYFEISEAKTVNAAQVEIIKNHLNLVFKHEIDPIRESETIATKEELNAAHKPQLPVFGGNDPQVRC